MKILQIKMNINKYTDVHNNISIIFIKYTDEQMKWRRAYYYIDTIFIHIDHSREISKNVKFLTNENTYHDIVMRSFIIKPLRWFHSSKYDFLSVSTCTREHHLICFIAKFAYQGYHCVWNEHFASKDLQAYEFWNKPVGFSYINSS